MKPQDISKASNPDLRTSLTALHRAVVLARETAIQTGTELVVVREGRIVRVSAAALRKQADTQQGVEQ